MREIARLSIKGIGVFDIRNLKEFDSLREAIRRKLE